MNGTTSRPASRPKRLRRGMAAEVASSKNEYRLQRAPAAHERARPHPRTTLQLGPERTTRRTETSSERGLIGATSGLMATFAEVGRPSFAIPAGHNFDCSRMNEVKPVIVWVSRVRTACGWASMAARMRSRSIPTKTGRSLRRASASWSAGAKSASVTGPARVTIPPISPSMPCADQFDQAPDLPRPQHANGRVAEQELSSSIAVP